VILDTNALSAWAEGNPAIEPHFRSAERLVVPSVVLGEFDFGIRQSRHRQRYEQWLKENLPFTEIAVVDEITAGHYGSIRLALKRSGKPIPVNDTWIAAVAVQYDLPVLSRDEHFDLVRNLLRISW